ncbi:uncharacterized protein [Aquarana catesbeiana]|uniref:uncharacterized protein isoform X3 n=1 Tax=Aquarana catesbeiana TaxID=8400 RepID=UPI003CC9938D
MASSATTSLNMKNQAIITKYLKQLSAGKWKKFKMALCNPNHPGEAEEITMENLKGKSMERVIEVIFTYYNENLGTEKIKKILKDLKEHDLCRNMHRRLSETSKRMRDMQVSTSSKDATPNDDTVSSSEPPAKKIRQEDGDVPGQSQNTEQNVHKMGGPSSTQEEPKQGTSHHVQQNTKKKGGPRSAQGQLKQEIPDLSELIKYPSELFKEVQARPALYNRNNPENRNKELKKNLWEEVASKVVKDWEQLDSKVKEETVIRLRQKWRNFADSFRREYKRQTSESTSGSTPSKNTKYRYYEQLMFLECRMDQRQTSSNLDGKQDDMQQDYENDDDCREKKNQAAANKTKESEQVLQSVSEGSSQASKRMRDMQVSISSKDATPNDDTVSSSEPPAKKITQKDRDVPGQSQNTEQNVHKMGGPSQSQEEPKQGIAHKIQQNVEKKGEPKPDQIQAKQGTSHHVQQNANKKGEPRPAQGQLKQGTSHHVQQNANKKGEPRPAQGQLKQGTSHHIQQNANKKGEPRPAQGQLKQGTSHRVQNANKKGGPRSAQGQLRQEIPSKNTNRRYYEQPKFLECRMDQRQTSSNLDGEQGDMQQDYENDDDCRGEKKQAAASKTKESKQVLQTVSEGSSQGNALNDKDENRFLESFMKKMREIPSENKYNVIVELHNILEKYSKPVSNNDNATTM